MEPPPKRLRLLEPYEPAQRIVYESDDYSEPFDDEDASLDAGEGQEGEDRVVEQGDPDALLEQKRAQLDLKLKSKFEAIFEKYGRDFTGIGDEIDLRTGEIVVDNGHLLEMEDERDDGTAKPSLLEAFTKEPEKFGCADTADDEWDEVDDSHVRFEDLEEDDMILFQNSGPLPEKPNTPPARRDKIDRMLPRQAKASQVFSGPRDSFPSEIEILAQFGQELGSKIARYVSQQRVKDNSAIEPAWQTPGLPLATPGRRPILKSILLQPDSDRSPSPKGSSSVWAPKRPRGRPRRDGADVAAVFRGETVIRDRTWYSSGYVSTTVTTQRTEHVGQSQSRRTMSVPLSKTLNASDPKSELVLCARSKQSNSSDKYGIASISDCEQDSSEEKVAKYYRPRRAWSNPAFDTGKEASRNSSIQLNKCSNKREDGPSFKGHRRPKIPFTAEDDEILLEWVNEATRRGFSLWSSNHWKLLAEKNPRHTYMSWSDRYRRRFWQNGAIPSFTEEESRGSIESESIPEVPRQTRMDYPSGSERSFSGESSYRTSRDVSPPKSKLFRNDFSRGDLIDFSGAETIDTVKPPLDSALLEFSDKTEELVDPYLYQSQASRRPHSPAALLGERVDNRSNIIENDFIFTSLSSSGGPQKTDFKAGQVSGQIIGTVNIEGDDNQAAAEGIKNASEDKSPQIILTTGVKIPEEESIPPCVRNTLGINPDAYLEDVDEFPSRTLNPSASVNDPQSSAVQTLKQTTTKTPVVRVVDQFQRNSFGAAYSFSDDEEILDAGLIKPRASLYQAPKVSAFKASAKAQKINHKFEAIATNRQNTPVQKVFKSSTFTNNRSPIVISSSSSEGDLSDNEVEEFFLRPNTPVHRVLESNVKLSRILGPDDFEELRDVSASPLMQSSQEKVKTSGPKEGQKSHIDDVRPNPARNSSPKWRTPMSTTRSSMPRRSLEASPTGPLVETPSGSLKRCGVKGFRCGKEFCFKCMED